MEHLTELEQLTPDQAFDILWEAGGVRVKGGFYEDYQLIILDDIIDFDVLEKQSKQQSEKEVCEYLRNYEVWSYGN